MIYNLVNMRLKKLPFIVFTVVLGSWHLNAFAQTVNFPDPNVAAAVRGALNLGATDPITQTDLARLTSLATRDAGVRDLTGLEAAINLTWLSLSDNQISDVRALSSLTNLTQLSLAKNQIRDISALSSLTNLTWLILSDNRISDIRALSDLTNLTVLVLRGNQIRDIRALSSLTNLQTLDISINRISDIRALSDLTNLTWLIIDDNPITDISPLSNLLNLEGLVIHPEFDEKYPGVLTRIIPANTQIFFVYPTNPEIGVPIAREQLSRKIVPRCGLGWAPQSQYAHHRQQPKVMMYALEFVYSQHGYTCSAIEIRTGDTTLSHLDDWKLYLGTRYNPSYIPIVLTQANSQITNGVLRLTPEMLGLETFPCNTVGGISHPLPGIHYVLKTDENLLIDTAYSCFVWGQNAYTTVNGVNVKSQRSVSSAVLRDMETPRLERYIPDPTGVFITYTSIEDFQWDRIVLSDWLLASPSEPSAPGAPSAIQRKLSTTWGALKKQ